MRLLQDTQRLRQAPSRGAGPADPVLSPVQAASVRDTASVAKVASQNIDAAIGDVIERSPELQERLDRLDASIADLQDSATP